MEANLGLTTPRWAPTTEEDIRKAVDAGLIKESHFIDAKRETGSTSGDRKETARDLASYAIDGGAPLFGVGEDKASNKMYLDPQPLNGLIEKIDNIAATIINAPLTVVSIEIPSEKDPTLGYVLAHIPPSQAAPHMVDGRYYARNERTRRPFADAEVLRFRTRRESTEEQVGHLLDIEIAREPVPDLDRRLGHFYLVAQPIGAPARLARSLTRENRQAVTDLIWNTEPNFQSQSLGANIIPTPRYATNQSNRANGISLHSHHLSGAGRTVVPNPNNGEKDEGALLGIELRDDCGIRVLVGRATYQHGRTPGESVEYILDDLAVAYARRLIGWTVEIGERTGWRGTWMLGIHGDRIRGRASRNHTNNLGVFTAPTYDEATYREVTTASHLEMQQRPNTVAQRIVGRLIDTLGTFSYYTSDLTDA